VTNPNGCDPEVVREDGKRLANFEIEPWVARLLEPNQPIRDNLTFVPASNHLRRRQPPVNVLSFLLALTKHLDSGVFSDNPYAAFAPVAHLRIANPKLAGCRRI